MRPSLRRPALLDLGLAFLALAFLGFAALGPLDPEAAPPERRYEVRLLWNAGEVVLSALAVRHALTQRGPTQASVALLAAALVGWTAADVMWTYANFAGTDVPYPGPPDVGYVVFNAANVAAMLLLLLQVRRRLEGLDLAIAVVLPLTVVVMFLTFLLPPADDLLLMGLNGFYLTADAASVALAGLLVLFARPTPLTASVRRLALGLGLMGATNATYAITTQSGAYFTGSWVDLLYLVSIGTIGWALLRFGPAEAPEAPAAPRPGPGPGPREARVAPVAGSPPEAPQRL